MFINSTITGYYLPLAFYSVIPRNVGGLFLTHYDIILLLHISGPLTEASMYVLLRSVHRSTMKGYINTNLTYLLQTGYVVKVAGKYQVTDKALLLIAKVERKLQAILKEKGLIEVKPVGRPNRGGNMKEL